MRFARRDSEGGLDFVRHLRGRHSPDELPERDMASVRLQPAVVKDQDRTVDGVLNGARDSLEQSFGNHLPCRYFL